MSNRDILIAGAAVAALLLWHRKAVAYIPDTESLIENDVGFLTDGSVAATFEDTVFWEDEPYWMWSNPMENYDVSNPDKNVAAFLYMIRASEHLFPSDVVDTDTAYRTFYGGSLFNDFSDHPVITGEKVGYPLSDSTCVKAGFKPGCVSTAAGAYQINRPTWNEFRKIHPRLPDFSPASQDEAARRILDRIGALPFIESGDFVSAIRIAGQRWASLPGARGGQKQRSQVFAMSRINEVLNQG